MDLDRQICSHFCDIHPYIPGLSLEDLLEKYHLPENEILKLGSNENSLGSSPLVKKAIEESLSQISLYPDSAHRSLRNALAKKNGLKAENVMIGSGSDELIFLLGKLFLNANHSVAFPKFSFAMYKLTAQLCNAEIIESPSSASFSCDVEKLVSAVRKETKLVFLANPNNPTGTLLAEEEIHFLVNSLPDSVQLVIDEAYFEFLEKPFTCLKYVLEGRKNICVLRTFSKAYGLAGLRIGYVMGSEKLIDWLNRIRPIFNVTSVALSAALEALKDENHLLRSRKSASEARKLYFERMKNLGVECFGREGNFVLIRVENATKVAENMLKKGVIVRNMKMYDLENYIRISFGTPDQNNQCLRVFEEALSAQK